MEDRGGGCSRVRFMLPGLGWNRLAQQNKLFSSAQLVTAQAIVERASESNEDAARNVGRLQTPTIARLAMEIKPPHPASQNGSSDFYIGPHKYFLA